MSKTSMAAIVREPGGSYALEEVELDDLRSDEVYIRVEAAGVCHTDANMQVMVPMPAVVGHEGAGVVEQVGSAVTAVMSCLPATSASTRPTWCRVISGCPADCGAQLPGRSIVCRKRPRIAGQRSARGVS